MATVFIGFVEYFKDLGLSKRYYPKNRN